ncbi:hypothetical protein D3C76_1331420 [compost metagenome]
MTFLGIHFINQLIVCILIIVVKLGGIVTWNLLQRFSYPAIVNQFIQCDQLISNLIGSICYVLYGSYYLRINIRI